MKEIKKYLEPRLGEVESVIEDALRSDVGLLDATNRSLRENTGKMMRPSLALLVADALGVSNEDTIRYAAASELLHNATLLHDDVVDGASERRGRPTVASFLSPQASVLIGDYWLVKAVKTILSATHSTDRAIRIFAGTLSHLAEGELLQMEKASSGDTTQEDYERIIYCKTGSLFEASALTAALSVDAPEDAVKAMGEFGKLLGMAFQVKDDWMDYASADGALGKPVGIDLKEQKITQPLLCALDGAPEEAEIRGMVTRISDNPELGHAVRDFVISRGGVDKAALKVDEFIGRAVSCLDFLPEGPAKDRLLKIARFVGDREK
ncbi:MAG: polyprenyl synthetase family protein [Bacteroidales bacterium]|nr:polyprenyl synthetase family protein [Bacteroidales bacterium]